MEPETAKFFCEKCKFYTNNKKDFSKHIRTPKHLKNMLQVNKETTNSEKILYCKCGKTFKSRGGFYKHKKKCTPILNCKSSLLETKNSDEIIMYLLNQNLEQQFTIMELNNQLKAYQTLLVFK